MACNGHHVMFCLWVVALASQGILIANAHSHQGCGHSLVAEEAKRWSQLHRQQQQHAQQRTAVQANVSISASAEADLPRDGRPTPRLLAETTVPIRIWVEYQGVETLATAGKQQLRDTVNIALGVLQKFYKVRRPAPGRLTVKPFCRMWDSANYCNQHQPDFLRGGSDNSCGSAQINASHIASYQQCSLGGFNCETYQGGGGEYTDYYLYITAIQDEHCASGAVAWALPCLYDDATNRPLLGSANICPEALLNSDEDAGVAVLVHELTHALGFTDDMFDKFIRDDGSPIPQSEVVQQYQDAYGRSTAMIITPTVVKETQAQFGCTKIPGAALENEGGQGSANAHWEYRWFQGELMVATNLFAVYGKAATLSRITLAFMQDTGWYDVQWEQAGFLNWGYQAGCDFVAKTCTDYMSANPGQQYYCTKEQYADTVNTVCTFDGFARAKCEDAQFADGCIMKVALGTKPNCLTKQFESAAGDKFGWQNGIDSRCTPVTWLFNTFAYQFPDSTYKDGWKDSMCYDSSCSASGVLQLNILGTKVDCPSGQAVDLAKVMPNQFQKGVIGPCPDNKVYCGSFSCGESCTVGGTCVQGKCYCNLEYTGDSCGKKLTPDGNYTNYVPVVDGGSPSGGGAVYDDGFIMVIARLSNDQEELYLALDKYKSAVAQLAGVTTSRVAVLSFLTSEPATSLIGRRLQQQTSASSSSSDSGPTLLLLPDGQDSSRGLQQLQRPQDVADINSLHPWSLLSDSSSSSSSGGHNRQLRQLSSGQLEVYSRIATLSAADAAAITSRINNATRQTDFQKNLSAAGLKLVVGSISVRSVDSGSSSSSKGWNLPGVNMADPNTRRIIIIVACSVGAGLLVIIAGCIVSCCLRKRRANRYHANRSQQQFLTSPAGYAGYYSNGATPSNSSQDSNRSGTRVTSAARTSGAGPIRTLFGGSSRAQTSSPARNGQLVNPFAGSNVNWAARGSGAYTAPGAAVTAGASMAPTQGLSAGPLPVGGYTVNGQTFRTAKEAEDYSLALALQRSMHQSGPPGQFLPHSGMGTQQYAGYPSVPGYGFGRR